MFPERCLSITGSTAREASQVPVRSISMVFLPLCERHIGNPLGRSRNSGVVDQDVDATAEGLKRLLCHSRTVRFFRYIGFDEGDIRAELLERGHGLAHRSHGARRNHDLCAGACISERDLFADSVSAAGDYRDPVLQFIHSRSFLWPLVNGAARIFHFSSTAFTSQTDKRGVLVTSARGPIS